MQKKWREQELGMVRKKKREREELTLARDQQIRQKRESQVTIVNETKKEAEKNAIEKEKLRNELLELQFKQNQVMNVLQLEKSLDYFKSLIIVFFPTDDE